MSRMFLGSVLTAALVAGVAIAADSATVGLKQGDPIGAFYVTKVAGAEDDGVKNGQELCYRCKYGQRPMVMVFTRKNSEQLSKLVSELDKAVDKHGDAQLRAFVTVMGEDQSSLKSSAKELAEASKSKKVPVAVASDTQNGPASYRLDPEAEVTVILANESQVVASHSFKADSVDSSAVLKEIAAMLQ
jgi:hypothetical protein